MGDANVVLVVIDAVKRFDKRDKKMLSEFHELAVEEDKQYELEMDEYRKAMKESMDSITEDCKPVKQMRWLVLNKVDLVKPKIELIPRAQSIHDELDELKRGAPRRGGHVRREPCLKWAANSAFSPGARIFARFVTLHTCKNGFHVLPK